MRRRVHILPSAAPGFTPPPIIRRPPSHASRLFRASRILPFLYLGNMLDTTLSRDIADAGIKMVLSVCRDPPPSLPENIRHLHLILADQPDAPIGDVIEDAARFIDIAYANNTTILVHCMEGISRSSSMVIYWLMSRMRMSYDDAFRYVLSIRSIISPNLGFLVFLQNKSNQMGLENSTRPSMLPPSPLWSYPNDLSGYSPPIPEFAPPPPLATLTV